MQVWHRTNVRPGRLLAERLKFARNSTVSPGMYWSSRACCCSWKRRPKLTPTTMLIVCCPNWSQTASVSCAQASSFSKTAPQLTLHALRRLGCKQTVLGSLRRRRRISGPKLAMCELTGVSRLGTMLENYDKLQPKRKTTWVENRFADRGMSCHKHKSTFNKAMANFTKRLTACVAANGGHFEHLQ